MRREQKDTQKNNGCTEIRNNAFKHGHRAQFQKPTFFLYIATNNSKMKFKIVIYNYSRTHTQNIGINGGGEGMQEL